MIENIIKSTDYYLSKLERFDLLITSILKYTKGNIVEIGGGNGESTKIFLKAAKRYDRKVLVIDPFEKEWKNIPESYGKPYPFDVFKENTKGDDNLIIHKERSLHKSTKEKILDLTPLSFVFVDGLQFEEIVLKELRMLELFEPNIICVDDINRCTEISQVPEAVKEFLKDSKYKMVEMKTETQECYLIKK